MLAAETDLSADTVGKYARAYLRGINAELLGREVRDKEAFRAWTALYRSFATRIQASRKARAVQARLLRLSIESLDRTGQPITYSAVEAMTRYYAQPTPAQLVGVQERIFLDRVDLTRTHLRAPPRSAASLRPRAAALARW